MSVEKRIWLWSRQCDWPDGEVSIQYEVCGGGVSQRSEEELANTPELHDCLERLDLTEAVMTFTVELAQK